MGLDPSMAIVIVSHKLDCHLMGLDPSMAIVIVSHKLQSKTKYTKNIVFLFGVLHTN